MKPRALACWVGRTGSRQRVDVVVVEIYLEVTEWIDEVDHDVAAHGAEFVGADVRVAHDTAARRVKHAVGILVSALVEADDLRQVLATEVRRQWRRDAV